MTLTDILPQVEKLSNADKLALIEATAHMLQNTLAADNGGQTAGAVAESPPIRPYYLDLDRQKLATRITELLNRPDPTPDQMLKCGMFAGRVPVNEKYFRMAEWHPGDEELSGE